MREKTNGRPRSSSKRLSYTPELGRVKATSRSNPLSPSTGTPTYPWRPALSTSSINSLINIQGLSSSLMPSKSNDAGLQAAIASVRTDDGPSGKRNDFEHAATNLLPYDRVAKKRLRETKRGAGMISSVMDIADGCPMKWRQNTKVKPTAKSDGKVKKQSYTKKQLASLVTKRVKHEMDKTSEGLKTKVDTKAYIMSLIQEAVAPGTKSQVSSVVNARAPTLNSILKRAKNPET
jgi:hypothetical protein